ELYPDERFGGEPLATGRPVAVGRKIFPEAAVNDRGEDQLERILEVDRSYVEPPKDPRFAGYAHDHWIELDFGDRLPTPDSGKRLILFLHGWVEYTFSHINYAAYQAGLSMDAPRIEIPDGEGGWRVAVPDAGFPAGLPRMMTMDLSSLPIREHGRLRIRTNMEVFWDRIFAAEDEAGSEIPSHMLRPVVAQLRHLGYPREYSPDGNEPILYDYHRLDQGVSFKNMTGYFTRFGDVRELLESVDDQFVIMGRGEEIALEFESDGLPELPPGWSRTFVLHSHGYCKDMDLYTAFPDTVGPLPYRTMKNYPPEEPYPETDVLKAYRQTWNTRYVAGKIHESSP
ncbi:MAG: cytochrome c biogenesis factor, partial [Verrucomicrobiota bacterium]